MERLDSTKGILDRLSAVANSGFAIALHVRFTTPTYLFQTYDNAWMHYYSSAGLVMHDPTVRWGFEHDGTIRWEDLAPLDKNGVLDAAREHGLAFGVTMALSDGDSKSIASFSKSDLEFSEDEVNAIRDMLVTLHRETMPRDDDAEFQDALKKLSVDLTHG
ncbi:MAG: autoinducer binding domain-containing protein [Pseudomonadota bacterium]